jgi:hypothetical protein
MTQDMTLAALKNWVAIFSIMIDDGIEAEGPSHHRRIRCSKVAEEVGECEEALVAMEGSNPRKPIDTNPNKLIKEELDVAFAALAAVEHLTGNRGQSVALFYEHARATTARLMEVTA